MGSIPFPPGTPKEAPVAPTVEERGSGSGGGRGGRGRRGRGRPSHHAPVVAVCDSPGLEVSCLRRLGVTLWFRETTHGPDTSTRGPEDVASLRSGARVEEPTEGPARTERKEGPREVPVGVVRDGN